MAEIDRLLAAARSTIAPRATVADLTDDDLLIDIRPSELRERDGGLPGAIIVDRNVLEWRLDPSSPHRLPALEGVSGRVVIVCDEGFASSLAAATMRGLGLHQATDLAGGFQVWRDAQR